MDDEILRELQDGRPFRREWRVREFVRLPSRRDDDARRRGIGAEQMLAVAAIEFLQEIDLCGREPLAEFGGGPGNRLD